MIGCRSISLLYGPFIRSFIRSTSRVKQGSFIRAFFNPYGPFIMSKNIYNAPFIRVNFFSLKIYFYNGPFIRVVIVWL